MSKRGGFQACAIMLAMAAGVLLYPPVRIWQAGHTQTAQRTAYERAVQAAPRAKLAAQWQQAEAYNSALRGGFVTLPPLPGAAEAIARGCLALPGAGSVVGTLEIPGIGASLPVHHNPSETALGSGAGRVAGTALPVGGPGTHAVLAGRNSGPQARLFSGLSGLRRGDTFCLYVLGRHLSYTVDKIQTTPPAGSAIPAGMDGMDRVTLVAATPAGTAARELRVCGVRSVPTGIGAARHVPVSRALHPMQPTTAVGLTLGALSMAGHCRRHTCHRNSRVRPNRSRGMPHGSTANNGPAHRT